jgi:hypothetical protein
MTKSTFALISFAGFLPGQPNEETTPNEPLSFGVDVSAFLTSIVN